MRVAAKQTVLLTGASGGLGTFMAYAFAERHVRLALVAHVGVDLKNLQAKVESMGSSAVAYNVDLRESQRRKELVAQVTRDLGPVDVLVNNAGVEFTSFYHELEEREIRDVLNVNLEAPMMLAWAVLPGMLSRKSGHIVNISSLAGKSGPAYQEPYAATKAALIAFTLSLRATYKRSGVSASAITPGFVEAGIYSRLKEKVGRPAPALLGSSPPERIAAGVIRAIESDLPELIINPLPVRPLFALAALFPQLGERIIHMLGANEFFRRAVDVQKRARH